MELDVIPMHICHALPFIMFFHILCVILIIMIKLFHDGMCFCACYDDAMQIYDTCDVMQLIACGYVMLRFWLCHL